MTNINFVLVKSDYKQEVLTPLDFDLPLKIQFMKIVKIVLESSVIAHSIGNFILKNNELAHFRLNYNLRIYDVITLYDVISPQLIHMFV